MLDGPGHEVQHHRRDQVPDGAAIGLSETGSWSFPEGTVFVEHFDLALDEELPDERRRLETRVLVLVQGGHYAVTYRWNTDGTDAELALEGSTEPVRVNLPEGASSPTCSPAQTTARCAPRHPRGLGRPLRRAARTARRDLRPLQSASDAGAFLVVPADPDHSVLFQRSATTARGLGMPPLGRSVPDPTYVGVLERWIRPL